MDMSQKKAKAVSLFLERGAHEAIALAVRILIEEIRFIKGETNVESTCFGPLQINL